jgi:hypothetical protein
MIKIKNIPYLDPFGAIPKEFQGPLLPFWQYFLSILMSGKNKNLLIKSKIIRNFGALKQAQKKS